MSVKKSRNLGFRVPLRDAEKEKTSNNKFKGNFLHMKQRITVLDRTGFENVLKGTTNVINLLFLKIFKIRLGPISTCYALVCFRRKHFFLSTFFKLLIF
jgi:hypothetical protein